ncbi:hypothetical protein [Calothrix sp. PCC 6303]|uniref:hypothetical protein n=1 Tax=Calothrix sp. PCC 6303 TaxID=1170562 RepID=UPI0002A03417|nr:hypothetical protein [Calothrix sp. PCC 6303]AFZ02543.1 hypothetical protein Cal6303_3618 [Calothrix sp. PCC 6303]
MARAIERIERDIEALEEKISAIASELEAACTGYLTTLGQAVRQQLILASYHLCTQGYPENFLRLSLNQRQKLQKALRQLGTQTSEQLIDYTKPEPESSTSITDDEETEEEEEKDDDELDESFDELSLSEKIIFNLGSTDSIAFAEIAIANGESPFETEETELSEEKPDVDPRIKQQVPALPKISILPKIIPVKPLRFAKINPSNPVEVSKWYQSIELAAQYNLKKTSHEANLILQKANLLPQKLPPAILEAATAASENSAEIAPAPPNLLNLVIEVGNKQQSRESGLTKIMAINLRLAEIEFADSNLSSQRRQINEILTGLQKLRREYLKKQRERSIAEAEGAWRASWYED